MLTTASPTATAWSAAPWTVAWEELSSSNIRLSDFLCSVAAAFASRATNTEPTDRLPTEGSAANSACSASVRTTPIDSPRSARVTTFSSGRASAAGLAITRSRSFFRDVLKSTIV